MIPWPVAHQAPLSMAFSRQDYWSGFPFPSPEDLPDPGIKPVSYALAGEFFTMSHLGRPTIMCSYILKHWLFLSYNKVDSNHYILKVSIHLSQAVSFLNVNVFLNSLTFEDN